MHIFRYFVHYSRRGGLKSKQKAEAHSAIAHLHASTVKTGAWYRKSAEAGSHIQNAILAVTIRVIAAQGLGAPTAAIAQEAGVSNGSLFTSFEMKADLLNRVYVELKAEMAAG